jgi:hypothetical protein
LSGRTAKVAKASTLSATTMPTSPLTVASSPAAMNPPRMVPTIRCSPRSKVVTM